MSFIHRFFRRIPSRHHKCSLKVSPITKDIIETSSLPKATWKDGRFVSQWEHELQSESFFEYLLDKRATEFTAVASNVENLVVPQTSINRQLFDQNEQMKMTWMGHSSCYLNIGEMHIMTDPIWSQRSSPLQFFGPKRIIQPPISLEEIPIDVVLLSHTHYDHLDSDSVQRIGNRAIWIVPLNVGPILMDLGIHKNRIIELNWWESVEITKNNNLQNHHQDVTSSHFKSPSSLSHSHLRSQHQHNDHHSHHSHHTHSISPQSNHISSSNLTSSPASLSSSSSNNSDSIIDHPIPSLHPPHLSPPLPLPLSRIRVTFSPSLHWTSRNPFDRNQALWGGFAIKEIIINNHNNNNDNNNTDEGIKDNERLKNETENKINNNHNNNNNNHNHEGAVENKIEGIKIEEEEEEHKQRQEDQRQEQRQEQGERGLAVGRSVYFAGDTAYDPSLFRLIGDTLGPFDLALIPIGAYAPRWFMKYNHCNPLEALLIHRDLHASRSVAIHWGTFPLAHEHDVEPALELAKRRKELKIDWKEFFTMGVGETIEIPKVSEEEEKRRELERKRRVRMIIKEGKIVKDGEEDEDDEDDDEEEEEEDDDDEEEEDEGHESELEEEGGDRGDEVEGREGGGNHHSYNHDHQSSLPLLPYSRYDFATIYPQFYSLYLPVAAPEDDAEEIRSKFFQRYRTFKQNRQERKLKRRMKLKNLINKVKSKKDLLQNKNKGD